MIPDIGPHNRSAFDFSIFGHVIRNAVRRALALRISDISHFNPLFVAPLALLVESLRAEKVVSSSLTRECSFLNWNNNSLVN